jgi:hypothetical protein
LDLASRVSGRCSILQQSALG